MIAQIRIGSAQLQQNYGVSSKKKLEHKEFKKILKEAKNNGILKIDTAEAYESAHDFFHNFKQKKLNIGTKIEISKKNKYETLKKKIQLYQKIFKHHHFDYLLIHNFKKSEISILKKNIKHLFKIRDETVNFKIGVSIYDLKDFIKLKKIISSYKIDIVQLPINIFYQRFLKKKYVNFFKKNNILIQARSIFSQGLALMNKNEIQKKLKFPSYSIFSKWDKFNKYSVLKKVYNCVQFIKNQSNINEIVIGFNELKELKHFLIAYKKKKTIKSSILKQFKINSDQINIPVNWKFKL